MRVTVGRAAATASLLTSLSDTDTHYYGGPLVISETVLLGFCSPGQCRCCMLFFPLLSGSFVNQLTPLLLLISRFFDEPVCVKCS